MKIQQRHLLERGFQYFKRSQFSATVLPLPLQECSETLHTGNIHSPLHRFLVKLRLKKVMSYSPPSLTFSKALTGRGSASQILLSNEFVVFTVEKLICLAHKFGLQGPLCFPPCEVSFLSLLKVSLQPWHFIVCRFALLNIEHFIHLLSWSVEGYLKDTIRRHVLLILAWSGISLHSCKLLCNCMSTEKCNEQSKGQVWSTQPQHEITCLAEPFHSSTLTRNPSEMDSILTGCCCIRQSRNIIICSRKTQQFLAGTPWPARQELQNSNPFRT